MIRVGFVLAVTDRRWVGGINYLSNLIAALVATSDGSIEPVLLVSPRTPSDILADFPKVETIRTPIVTEGTALRKGRKVLERGLGRDFVMEAFLRLHRIDVLSHSDQLGPRAGIPAVGWIADFQHLRVPAFFEPAERAARDAGYRRLTDACRLVVFSSEDARQDLQAFAPEALPKSRVLHFVARQRPGVPSVAWDEVRLRHGIDGPFLHLPNQYWAHKNHGVAIDAIALLKRRGQSVTVISTGMTQDRRRPEYFQGIRQRIVDNDVENEFRILGLVPYDDMRSMMVNAAAVINPSLFEGWSTTVEEAKSLGKTIILSDIGVHREQAPERGLFFDPRDPEGLAARISEALAAADPERERVAAEKAATAGAAAFSMFGQNFQSILREAVA